MIQYRPWLVLIVVGVGLVLVSLPFWAPPLYLTLAIRTMFFGLLAMSLNFLAGQLNKVSLTQTAFFGVGGHGQATIVESLSDGGWFHI